MWKRDMKAYFKRNRKDGNYYTKDWHCRYMEESEFTFFAKLCFNLEKNVS